MEKRIKFFWIAGFFLPAINATVFKVWTFSKEIHTLGMLNFMDLKIEGSPRASQVLLFRHP